MKKSWGHHYYWSLVIEYIDEFEFQNENNGV